LVAHFHNVIIGGVVFGVMAGFNYWFPKAFGFTLDERWGKAAFWCWLIGFYLAFMPLYVLGLMGMTRRMQHYDNLDWQPWLLVAAVGAAVILVGIVCQVVQLVVSIRAREQLRDVTGDPWNGRTLEWSTASPPPAWNFAVLPRVAARDGYWSTKQCAHATQDQSRQAREYAPIEMPKNSASEAGPAPKRIVVAYGFWIFLLSDIVMFSALFAAYAVLVRGTAGGPTGAQLFNQVSVAIETGCLLVSSYTCGMMSLAVNARR